MSLPLVAFVFLLLLEMVQPAHGQFELGRHKRQLLTELLGPGDQVEEAVSKKFKSADIPGVKIPNFQSFFRVRLQFDEDDLLKIYRIEGIADSNEFAQFMMPRWADS